MAEIRLGPLRQTPAELASRMNLSGLMSIQDMAPLEIAVPVYGYVFPVVVMITVVTNSFIVLVLSQPQLRTPTNCILLAMAVMELLTGLASFPWMVYYYTLGGYLHDAHYGMPGFWCRTFPYFAELLPTIFHTSAIWLTVYLAIQRYWYVCSASYRRSIVTPNLLSLTRCKVYMGLICVAAVLVELPIVLGKYSTPYYTKDYTFCIMKISTWVSHFGESYFYNIYYWFHVIFVHAGPCTLLVIFGTLLIQTVRGAVKRRRESLGYLLRERDRSNYNNSSSTSSNLHATTKMLIVVIVIFLITEIPAAVIFTLHVLSNTFSVLPLDSYRSMNTALIFRNVFILISYPFNFAVYLSMSHQFRYTVRRIFCRQMGLFDTTINTDHPRRSTPTNCAMDEYRKNCIPLSSSCILLQTGRRRLSTIERSIRKFKGTVDPPTRPRSVSLAMTNYRENGPLFKKDSSYNLTMTECTSAGGTRSTLSSICHRNGTSHRNSNESRKISFSLVDQEM